MDNSALNNLAKIITNDRPDLMIITDDVYATFSDNFESIFSKCPYIANYP